MIGAFVPITILLFGKRKIMEIRLFDLDNRLGLCASLVRKNHRVADIGTDHAYLPVWLCKSNIATSAIASDVNPEPLKRGMQTIEKYCATNVTACLSDGLQQINPDMVDDIIIAGMGGELIADIISKTPWVKNEKYHLILQPMSKADFLREYLYSNGFDIKYEEATVAENKLYTVMSVYFTGETPQDISLKKYCGALNPAVKQENKSYIEKTANALLKKGNGILTSDKFSSRAITYISYANALADYAKTGTLHSIATVNDIYSYIDSFAPFNTALDYDNVGMLVGNSKAVVKNVLVALDITADVIKEAERLGADLIISHHPVIFRPLKSVNSDSIPYMLAQRNINAICAHTNLDVSPQGVNLCLAKALGLENIFVHSEGVAVGDVKADTAYSSEQLAGLVKESLNCNGVRYTDIKNKITRVAVGGGAGGEYIYLAKELGANAYVTGEIKHNYILESHDIGITVVDAGHYKTEDVVIDYLVDRLSKQFPQVSFTKSKAFTDYIAYV